jgi:hypothetical protein
MNQGTSSQSILNSVNIQDIYIKNSEQFLIKNSAVNVLKSHDSIIREPMYVF